MDTALPQKFPFILDRNLAKANCTENHVCTSCDTVVLGHSIYIIHIYMTSFIYTHMYEGCDIAYIYIYEGCDIANIHMCV